MVKNIEQFDSYAIAFAPDEKLSEVIGNETIFTSLNMPQTHEKYVFGPMTPEHHRDRLDKTIGLSFPIEISDYNGIQIVAFKPLYRENRNSFDSYMAAAAAVSEDNDAQPYQLDIELTEDLQRLLHDKHEIIAIRSFGLKVKSRHNVPADTSTRHLRAI